MAERGRYMRASGTHYFRQLLNVYSTENGGETTENILFLKGSYTRDPKTLGLVSLNLNLGSVSKNSVSKNPVSENFVAQQLLKHAQRNTAV